MVLQIVAEQLALEFYALKGIQEPMSQIGSDILIQRIYMETVFIRFWQRVRAKIITQEDRRQKFASIIMINRIETNTKNSVCILPLLRCEREEDLICFQKCKASCGIHQMFIQLLEPVRLQHTRQYR